MIFIAPGQVIAIVREAWDMGYCVAIELMFDTGGDYVEDIASESELFEAWVKNLVSHTGQRD